MKVFTIAKGSTGFDGLKRGERARPAPGPGQVLVRMRAASLNFRDLSIMAGKYFRGPLEHDTIPLSDGAGEVAEVGSGVTQFAAGDRVVATFAQGHPPAALGFPLDGCLTEYAVFAPDGLLRLPAHLSFEEAATLPCAGVTAWNGLFTHGHLQRDQFVLLEGTGGVSIFGLQFASAAGARPIITSSSDAKLERARKLGAVATVNYRTHPEWQEQVRTATHGAGVSHVLEIGGQDTLPKALASLGLGGHVALIGGLTGFEGSVDLGAVTGSLGSLTSVYVGSRQDFEAMNAFIAQQKLKPVIDRVFTFEEAPAAFDYLESGSHFGKVVIRL
jgi:NADPH:quinone reductase-like Zn-dependent oxidoreductase